MFEHHAQLIVGDYDDAIGDLEKQLKKHKVNTVGNPDIWSAPFDVFGIDDARRLAEMQLRTSVDGGEKLFIIGWRQATVEAQNALLKVFEEPTPNTHFFIITSQERLLLPTLRSRLATLSLGQEEPNISEAARAFAVAGPSKRLSSVSDIITEKDKQKALTLLNNLERIYKKSAMLSGKAGEALLQARRNLATRSPSLKLILEHLALTIPRLKE